MSKTRGAAGAAAAAATTEAQHELDPRPRQGDPLEAQVIEPATQPIVSEGSPSMHATEHGEQPGMSDVSAATDDAIAARAYELYQARGGTHGADMDDWLQAEQELRGDPAHRPID